MQWSTSGPGGLASHGDSGFSAVCLGLLAKASATAGQREEGLPLLEDGLAVRTTKGGVTGKPSCIGSKVNCVWPARRSMTREAETCFRHALDVTRRQQATSSKLRAAMSLRRLWPR